ncbi:MAG: hypothetical protein GY796_00725 [Chloroflexi bacterium]|nr:hypothetical protein [Chloroflexota bacterium]
MKMINRKNSLSLLLLAAICILAAYLRLAAMSFNPIDLEQSFLLRLAAQIVNSGHWPGAADQSFSGITQPPLILYSMALPLFVDKTVLAPLFWHGLLGVLAVAALFLYTNRLFGQTVGLLAAFLLAVNPWAIYAERVLAAASLTPLLATCLLGTVLLYFIRRSRLQFVLAFFWLGMLTQSQFSLPLLLSAMLLALIMIASSIYNGRRQRQTWPHIIFPIVIGLLLVWLPYRPYLTYEKATRYANVNLLIASLLDTSARPSYSLLSRIGQLLDASHLSQQYDVWQAHVSATFMGQVSSWLLALSWGYAWARPLWVFRQRQQWQTKEKTLLSLSLWITVPILLTLFQPAALPMTQLLFLLPAVCMVVAVFGVDTAAAISHRMPRPALQKVAAAAIVTLLLILGLWSAAVWHTGLTLLQNKTLSLGKPATNVTAAIASAQINLTPYPDCDLIVLAYNDHADNSPWGLVESFVYPTPVRYVENGRGFIEPQECALYTIPPQANIDTTWLSQHGRPLPANGATEWSAYYLPGQTADYDTETALAKWRNGLLLRRVTLHNPPTAGQTLTIDTAWDIFQKPKKGMKYHFFNHILNETGAIVTQEDGAGVHTVYWQPGDTIVNRFYLNLPGELPSGRYRLVTGMYTWPALERVRLQRSNETVIEAASFEIP